MADKMLVAFGRYLKLVRERRKMSLADVTTLTKSYPEPVGKGYLSRVERGLARVGFSKMVALSRAYEVSLDAFGEKLALDLEVDQLRDPPDTRGQTFGELTEAAIAFYGRGMRWHSYACLRDAVPISSTGELFKSYGNHAEQLAGAVLSHAVSAIGLGRHRLAIAELEFVRSQADSLNEESVPIVYQQLAVAKRRIGEIQEAVVLADEAISRAGGTPMRKHLADALESRALLEHYRRDFAAATAGLQRAYAEFKATGRSIDCARTLNNLAQVYFDERRFGAARRALGAANRLASKQGADSIRARSRILLGEIEAIEGNDAKASSLWHEALEIARRTRDDVVHFKAEFQLFKISIHLGNTAAVNSLGRRLNRMCLWISPSEPEVAEFRRLYSLHRKPKQRQVARTQLNTL